MKRTVAAIALVAAISAPAYAASIVLRDGARVMFAGDSTSSESTGHAWYDLAATGFVASVNAQFHPPPAKQYPAAVTGAMATVTGALASNAPLALPGAITVLDVGSGGTTVANLQASIAGSMSTNIPSVVFIAIGTNDVSNGTAPSTFRTSYDAVMASIVAFNPATQIACLSIYAQGEKWAAGPVWNNANDAAVDALNAQIQGSCTAAGGLYVDTRAALLLWEVPNNPTQAQNGFALLSDNIHLSSPAGKQEIGSVVLGVTQVVP